MKNTILLLCGIFMLTGFSACTKTEYAEPVNPNRTIYVDIPAGNWEPNPTVGSKVWEVSADIPEIDDFIMDSGTVLADISFDDGNTYEPLSSTYNQKGYRFNYGYGYILVDVQSTAANVDIDGPPSAIVKLVLVDSELID